MMLLGSDAVEKTGVKWVLSYKEHPSRVLAGSPEKADLGTSTLVALSKEIVSNIHKIINSRKQL